MGGVVSRIASGSTANTEGAAPCQQIRSELRFLSPIHRDQEGSFIDQSQNSTIGGKVSLPKSATNTVQRHRRHCGASQKPKHNLL